MRTYTEQQIENLNQNLKKTNWSNARIENNRLVADFDGKLYYSIGGGRTQPYNGVTTCKIYPSKKITETICDYGIDQNGFINQELDFCPINQRLNY